MFALGSENPGFVTPAWSLCLGGCVKSSVTDSKVTGKVTGKVIGKIG